MAPVTQRPSTHCFLLAFGTTLHLYNWRSSLTYFRTFSESLEIWSRSREAEVVKQRRRWSRRRRSVRNGGSFWREFLWVSRGFTNVSILFCFSSGIRIETANYHITSSCSTFSTLCRQMSVKIGGSFCRDCDRRRVAWIRIDYQSQRSWWQFILPDGQSDEKQLKKRTKRREKKEEVVQMCRCRDEGRTGS